MKICLFLTGILMPILIYSQQRTDTMRNSRLATTSPLSGGITISNSITPINTGGHTIFMQQPVVDFGIPLYKQTVTRHPIFIRSGARLQGIWLSNEKQLQASRFQMITIPFLLNYSISRRTSVALVATASVGSDLKSSVEGKDILYSVGARVGFQPSRKLRYGVTLTYVNNYSGNYLLPLPDIDWTINNRWNLSAILPARASLRYKLTDNQQLGITASIGGSMYRYNKNDSAQYIHLRQNSGGVIYDLKLGQRWKFTTIAGYTFMQKLEVFNLDQKISFNKFKELNSRKPILSYQQNSFMLQAGISFQF